MKPLAIAALSTSLLLGSSLNALAAPTPEFSFVQDASVNAGQVVIFMDGDGDMSATAQRVDQATGGLLSGALDRHDFEAGFGDMLSFKALAPFEEIVVIGTGDGALSSRQLADLGGHAAAHLTGDAIILTDGIESDVTGAAAFIATGFALRDYKFDRYKITTDPNAEADMITVVAEVAGDARGRYDNDLAHIVEGVTLARDLGTEPGNGMWPQAFVDRVRPHFRNVPNVRIDVMNLRDLEREGMGGLTGVGKGSVHDPRMMVIHYNGDVSGTDPIALVGKGITFDTGGISLKSPQNMWYMKSDLSGAAAVAGTLLATAKRGEAVNLVGIMPLAENMPARDAIRPGDVLTTMGGKTIEVISTDAEGRLILSDAVQYAQREFDPSILVTIATLTGSAARALGDDYAAAISRDFDFTRSMMGIGERAGEDVWPLPLNDNHFKAIQSDIADIKGSGGNPGASIGAAVIGTFIDEDQTWLHLDIAGVDWLDASRATTPKGHAGWGVRFMDQMVREQITE